MKIKYPLSAAEPGASLHTLDWYLTKNPNLKITNNGTLMTIDGLLTPSWAEVLQILAEGGEVESYQMVVRAPLAGLNVNVPAGLPDREKLTPTGTDVRTISEWLKPSDVWTDETYVYFLTTNITGKTLTGSEIKLLDDIAGVSILLTSDPEFVAIQNA